jgi:hypothetical protein
MRVYLPATLSTLAAALNARPTPGFPPATGYAVTPALREWYASGDTEELEYVAMSLAAAASVQLLADDPLALRRRVVVAADVDPTGMTADIDPARDSRGRVVLTMDVSLDRVAAVHVDDADAVPAVTDAARHPEDELAAGEAADYELLWYATQEIEQLVRTLTS